MKAQFTVTIEGKWWHNGKPATAAIVERELREAAKDRFEFLASRVTVRKCSKSEGAATRKAMSDSDAAKWCRDNGLNVPAKWESGNLGAANTNKGGEAK